MKEIHLIYNNFSNEYYLDFGKNSNQRNYLGKITEDEVINELKKRIDFKRKSALYLGREISVELAERVVKLFERTKIEIEVEK